MDIKITISYHLSNNQYINHGGVHGEELTPVVFPPSMASGTLPLVIINTENGDSILDKVTNIPATFCIQDLSGTTSEPVAITIRGRGNATWKSPKKPYKVKFKKSTEILDLPAARDFALIAWNACYGNIEWLSAICGMEMARILGMKWAPHICPVELILNGNYEGTYFVTETIKIAPERLDIYEQPSCNEDETTIPYGWLVEIDNYNTDNQIVIPEIDNKLLKVTIHSPKYLSDAQRQWITDEFTALNEAIYSKGAIDWTKKIDLTSLVQYYIIREIMFDTDGFNGSMYLYRDKADNSKWHFGPMWDIVLATGPKDDYTMNLLPSFSGAHWEPEFMRYEAFQNELIRVWDDFYPTKFNKLQAIAMEVAQYCEAADECNYYRWPELSYRETAKFKADLFWKLISRYAAWFDANKRLPYVEFAQWGDIHEVDISTQIHDTDYYDLQGRRIVNPRHGFYIRNHRKVFVH